MQRDTMIAKIEDKSAHWEVIIVGGGATGLGIALDAASRGYRTLLLERGDFGQGTSSRSTKLVHGGVRYLQQGNINLVLEALRERGILRRNAPHLVHDLPFVVPNYDWWEGPFYGLGLKIYDLMAGKEGLGKSKIISREETLKHIPTIETEGLNSGVIYYDGQFDDARLIINLARTAAEQGAVLINYMNVNDVIKENEMICGVIAVDLENEKEYTLHADVVVNAAGPYADHLRQMDDASVKSIIQPSQGVHLVLDRKFLPGDSAIMVPHTADGRVMFAIPWYDRVILGTTDTALDEIPEEPLPFPEEIAFLLQHAAHYLSKDPTEEDVLSVFAGIRPLVLDPNVKNTASVSRDHVIHISKAGLITIAGGKWTTYRKMAEETMEKVILVGNLEPQPCTTESLHIHGYHNHADAFGARRFYGLDAVELEQFLQDKKVYNERLYESSDFVAGEVIWAVRREMARTVEDVLARRRRILVLDARAAVEMAPKVARLMRKELAKGRKWEKQQIETFTQLARHYLVNAGGDS